MTHSQRSRQQGRPRLFLAGLLIALGICLGAPWAWAAEQFPSDPTHRGRVEVEAFQIFPENRPGNGVYQKDVLLLSVKGVTISDLIPLEGEGQFAYLGRDSAGEVQIGVRLIEGAPPPRVRKIAPGFFHIAYIVEGAGYKKLFREFEGKLMNVLPYSRTADGAVPGNKGVLFYHVANAENEEINGEVRTRFAMRVHLALFEEERLRSLNYSVYNARPSLTLSWIDDNRVQMGLAEGKVESISTAQFQ